MAVADKFANEPVVFIAVNSGSEPNDVKSYANSNKVKWPVIIDLDRTFETKANVNKVSVSNIWQFRSIDVDGKIESFRGEDIVATTQGLLKNAKWEIDAKQIPQPLMKAHRMVEFGRYASAADKLNDASKSRDEDLKKGADLLLAHVNGQITAHLELADQATQNDNPWKAYKTYTEIEDRFDGYEMEFDVKATMRELKTQKKVKDELSGARQFKSAKKQFARNGMKRTLEKLGRIVEKFPGTEAAAMSQEVIDSQSGKKK